MILLVQIICLCYTLYVLQEYATSGAYSRQHRLLPLLVGLIGVYNFYQVVLTLTGQTELFGRLKDMLLIQVLYLILIYIMDFLKIHIPYGVQWIMFCVLLALNVIVFMRYRQPEIYHIYFRIYLIGCTAAIVAMGTYAYLRRSLTMHEHQHDFCVYTYEQYFRFVRVETADCRLRHNAGVRSHHICSHPYHAVQESAA